MRVWKCSTSIKSARGTMEGRAGNYGRPCWKSRRQDISLQRPIILEVDVSWQVQEYHKPMFQLFSGSHVKAHLLRTESTLEEDVCDIWALLQRSRSTFPRAWTRLDGITFSCQWDVSKNDKKGHFRHFQLQKMGIFVILGLETNKTIRIRMWKGKRE